jgi:cell fate (sporulation/competence/biofilm development) regulator YlbF (YheA/YmcA/DUF963 family)
MESVEVELENGAVLAKTRELCETLVRQPAFVTLRRHVETFLEDEQAKRMYRELADESERLQQKQQAGATLTQDEVTAYEQKREALDRHDVARRFLDAQQQMQRTQQTISRYVNKTMELGRVPDPDDFGSCGQGCSCGH